MTTTRRTALQVAALAIAALPLTGCSYNTFVSQEEAIKGQWAQVENQLQRRNGFWGGGPWSGWSSGVGPFGGGGGWGGGGFGGDGGFGGGFGGFGGGRSGGGGGGASW